MSPELTAEVEAQIEVVALEVERAIVASGLTQLQLAARAELSTSTIHRVLCCWDLRLSTLIRLAHAAGYRARVVMTPIASDSD